MKEIAICGATRGRYSKPIPVNEAGINWVTETGRKSSPPLKYGCFDDNHWDNVRGITRKLYFPLNEMYYQKWELTEQEFQEATEAWDMFSIDMPSKIICEACKNKLNN